VKVSYGCLRCLGFSDAEAVGAIIQHAQTRPCPGREILVRRQPGMSDYDWYQVQRRHQCRPGSEWLYAVDRNLYARCQVSVPCNTVTETGAGGAWWLAQHCNRCGKSHRTSLQVVKSSNIPASIFARLGWKFPVPVWESLGYSTPTLVKAGLSELLRKAEFVDHEPIRLKSTGHSVADMRRAGCEASSFDTAYLRSSRDIRHFLALRGGARQRLLAFSTQPDRAQAHLLRKADDKVWRLAQRNRQRSKMHHKGYNSRVQRIGRGKCGSKIWWAFGDEIGRADDMF